MKKIVCCQFDLGNWTQLKGTAEHQLMDKKQNNITTDYYLYYLLLCAILSRENLQLAQRTIRRKDA